MKKKYLKKIKKSKQKKNLKNHSNMKRAEIIKNLYEEINKANFDVLDSTLDFEKLQRFIPNRSSICKFPSVNDRN